MDPTTNKNDLERLRKAVLSDHDVFHRVYQQVFDRAKRKGQSPIPYRELFLCHYYKEYGLQKAFEYAYEYLWMEGIGEPKKLEAKLKEWMPELFVDMGELRKLIVNGEHARFDEMYNKFMIKFEGNLEMEDELFRLFMCHRTQEYGILETWSEYHEELQKMDIHSPKDFAEKLKEWIRPYKFTREDPRESGCAIC
jgi:peptide subunit release factor 1 (eRF1)